MRLAFCLFNYFPFGGLQRDFLVIAKACQQRGHEISVYVMKWEGERPPGFKIYEIRARGLTNHQKCLNYAREMQNKLKTMSYDRVIGFNKMPGLDVYFAADSCFQEKARRTRSFLFRLTSRYKIYAALEKAVFAKEQACKILILNENETLLFNKYYQTPLTRFTLLPPGVDEDRVATQDASMIACELRDEFSVAPQDYLLLMVASDFKTKGLARCLQALAALPKDKLQKTHFFIVGDDKPDAYLPLAKKLNIDSRLVFMGPREDLARFYMAADLLLHPAHTENAGKVLLEALACGLPVLVTANCGYAYHVQRAKAGVVLPLPFSQLVFNQALLTALDAYQQRQQWRKNALSYVSGVDLFSLTHEAVDCIENACLC